MKKIGIYGGSFNPVHLGHIRLSEQAILELGLEKLIIVPTYIQPFKRDIEHDNPLDRLNMLNLSINNPKIEVSSYEIDKKVVSYTYDTLSYFKSIYLNYEIIFILGTDSFMNLSSWYKSYNLLTEFSFGVAIRPGENIGDYLGYAKSLYDEFDSKIYFLESEMLNISSTEIRKLIKENNNISDFVDDKVANYIYSNGLYKD